MLNLVNDSKICFVDSVFKFYISLNLSLCLQNLETMTFFPYQPENVFGNINSIFFNLKL